MRSRPGILLVFILLTVQALAVDTEPPFEDAEREALYQRLTGEVRCLVCQNQTVADSTAPLAADLRREIRRMVAEGQTEAQIEDFLLERYGDFVLYRPRFRSSTAVLWLAPVMLLAVGGVALARVIYRRRRLPADVDADEDGPP
ncbi:MAG: cytochrome c-type biogenesis protein CcmH [Gammaproteobacteria bacterium]|nr:cytochrome c-type biogenesis protein CcmH [Gammaproteobacteria bacterium]